MRIGELLLLAALGFAGFVLWRIHERGVSQFQPPLVPPVPAIPPGVPPPGAQLIPLGQYAVAPSRRWLLLNPGS
jgi:hypothetical protein